MTWLWLSVGSAVFLGIYDVMKKLSLTGNAVLPTLLFSTVAGGILFLFPFVLSITGFFSADDLFFVPEIGLYEHALIFLKTLIVLSSWILAFFAIKHLPLTIVAPIRSTSPAWTLTGAIVLFHEQLTPWQWVGMALTLFFFYMFSTAGKLENIHFKNNKYLWFIIGATIIGGGSGLYDKFLLQRFDRMAVQTYFTFYQVLVMSIVVALLWWPKRTRTTAFQWRWTIPLIGLFLAIADFLYFYALTYPDALISIISALRRVAVVISFGFGALLFKEKNVKKKSVWLIGIMIGVMILIFGK